MLPFLTGSKAKREMQREFRGLNRRPGAAENEFAAMENMTGAGYPLLASRSPRGRVRKLTKINGMLGGAQLCFVDGTDFFYEGACYGQVTDGEKLLVRMGGKILIFPDKLAFDTETYSFSPLENHVVLTGVTLAPTFSDGTALGSVTESGTQPGQPQDGMLWLDTRSHILKQYSAAQEQWAEVTGTRVALRGTGIGAGFRAGDGVRVSGTGVEELEGILLLEEATENEVVVTGLMARGKVISGQVKLDRDVPDLVLATELNNRLWGVEEGSQELLACKLGDPTNWHVFAGVSTDSYAVNVGSDGPFTGMCSFLGYALFFKEGWIHKLYGTRARGLSADLHPGPGGGAGRLAHPVPGGRHAVLQGRGRGLRLRRQPARAGELGLGRGGAQGAVRGGGQGALCDLRSGCRRGLRAAGLRSRPGTMAPGGRPAGAAHGPGGQGDLDGGQRRAGAMEPQRDAAHGASGGNAQWRAR